MDRLLAASTAGYQTRHEFAKDALEAMILELTYEAMPDEPTPADAGVGRKAARVAAAEVRPIDLEATVLHAPMGAVIDTGATRVQDEPMFGLHNRDYPSIWAAHFLARGTDKGPVPVDRFFEDVTAEAWRFADSLGPLERRGGAKLSAL